MLGPLIMRRLLLLTTLVIAAAAPAFAQVDLSGTWANRMHEDWQERWPGPDGGDFTGLPINDDARAKALAYSTSALSMPERQCLYYPPHYTEIGPFSLKIWAEAEPVTGATVAWHISGAVDRALRTVWMDGRPHPSPNALHTNSGFSTGRWEGRTLVVETTHIKAGPLRRNGVPASDQATMTEYISRHGDVLTILAVIDDPAYLTEPFVVSRNWQLDPNFQMSPIPAPCVPVIEVVGIGSDGGVVPHYLPGQNPYVEEFSKLYGLPVEATMGGAETLYPEFRRRLEGRYNPPATCGRYCCGWAGAGIGGPGDAPNLACVTRSPNER